MTEDMRQNGEYNIEQDTTHRYDDGEINVANDYISIEEELPNDAYVTINDINMIWEMNMAQHNIDPDTMEERQYHQTVGTKFDPGLQKETWNTPCYKWTNHTKTTWSYHDDTNKHERGH